MTLKQAVKRLQTDHETWSRLLYGGPIILHATMVAATRDGYKISACYDCHCKNPSQIPFVDSEIDSRLIRILQEVVDTIPTTVKNAAVCKACTIQQDIHSQPCVCIITTLSLRDDGNLCLAAIARSKRAYIETLGFSDASLDKLSQRVRDEVCLTYERILGRGLE